MSQYPTPKDLFVLVTVVRKSGFAAAAEELGQTPAFVTQRIQQLEAQIGMRLLNRDSRHVSLTEAGEIAYRHAGEILDQYHHFVDDIHSGKNKLQGPIRIGCSFGFGRTYIAPAIIALTEQYPALQVHLQLFDRQVDLSQDHIDLDIRVNDDIPSHYIAKLLTQNRRILCASPEYLRARGVPEKAEDLMMHDCLIIKERDQSFGVWPLENGDEKKIIKVAGPLSSNNGEIILQWALQGKGIMLRSAWDVKPLLDAQQLVQVLPDYSQSANIWAVYLTSLSSSARLKACVDFLARYCKDHPL